MAVNNYHPAKPVQLSHAHRFLGKQGHKTIFPSDLEGNNELKPSVPST